MGSKIAFPFLVQAKGLNVRIEVVNMRIWVENMRVWSWEYKYEVEKIYQLILSGSFYSYIFKFSSHKEGNPLTNFYLESAREIEPAPSGR